MTLDRLMRAADEAYPDGLVARAHRGEDTGDTLALFSARELADVHDPDASDTEQAAVACRALEAAIEELQEVRDALGKLRSRGRRRK
jgi:hypothetical protein